MIAGQRVATFALIVGLGLGFVAGRCSVESEPRASKTESKPDPRLAPSISSERAARAQQLRPAARPSDGPPLSPVARPASEIATPSVGNGGGHAHGHDGAHGDDAEPNGGPVIDEKAVAAALTRFKESADPEELGQLAAMLGASGGKPAARVALDVLAAGGVSPTDMARRASAFTLLASQEDGAARVPALDVLARESDPSLRLAALSALGSSRSASPEEASSIAARLAELAERDQDPEARRRAIRALVRWRSSDADIAPILRALEKDPDENVRGACCYALEDERVRSPAAIEALTRTVRNATAPYSVRELAAEALGRLGPLDPTARQALAQFEREAP